MSVTSHTPRRTVASALASASLVIVLLAGCGSDGAIPTGLGDGQGIVIGGGGGAGTPPPGNVANVPFLGRWFRGLIFVDGGGVRRTSETTWTFLADGRATRVVVARNVDTFFSDSVISTGTWSIEGGTTIAITFTAVGTGAGTGGTGVGGGSGPGSGFGGVNPPLTGNPPITGNPPFTGGTDTTGTGARGTVRFTFRVERASSGTTLFLDTTAYALLST